MTARAALVAVLVAGAVGQALALGACAPGEPGPGVDVARARAHVDAIAGDIGVRPGDTPASARAAAYIEAQLAALGLAVERLPVGAVEVPEITVLGATLRERATRTTTDPNLVVRLGPRAGPALLVMAHYDSVPTSPGAVDNAAAVAVVLELARALVAAPPALPVMLAFTANEERGLLGAEALAARAADGVGFAIALDLIGGTGALTVNGASKRIGAAELRWLAAAADRAGVVLDVPIPHRVVSRRWPQLERSDHGPFTRRGVRAVHLYHRGHDGELIDRAYHSMRDVPARVLPEALDELGRLLRALAAAPLPAPGGDGFWLPLAANTVVPRWLLIAAEVALAAAALAALVRAFRRRARGGLGALAGLGCYAAAAAVAYALERVTAGDHPAPWLHAPGAALVALALILGGSFGLATRLAARFAPWVGERRYLVLALAPPLVLGMSLGFTGAAELAWIWLLPAAAAAAAPALGRARLAAIAPLALPLVLVLRPAQVREAAWNGFLPPSIPPTVLLALLAAPAVAGVAWALRHGRATRGAGPLHAFAVPAACALAVVIGALVLASLDPPCGAHDFALHGLGCELGSP